MGISGPEILPEKTPDNQSRAHSEKSFEKKKPKTDGTLKKTPKEEGKSPSKKTGSVSP